MSSLHCICDHIAADVSITCAAVHTNLLFFCLVKYMLLKGHLHILALKSVFTDECITLHVGTLYLYNKMITAIFYLKWVGLPFMLKEIAGSRSACHGFSLTFLDIIFFYY